MRVGRVSSLVEVVWMSDLLKTLEFLLKTLCLTTNILDVSAGGITASVHDIVGRWGLGLWYVTTFRFGRGADDDDCEECESEHEFVHLGSESFVDQMSRVETVESGRV